MTDRGQCAPFKAATIFLRLGVFCCSLFWLPDSYASRLGRVDAVDVEVHAQPNVQSTVVGKLKQGDPVAASNLPVAGFHKVRTLAGVIGWVAADALVLTAPPTAEELVKAGAPSPEEEDPTSKPPTQANADSIQPTSKKFRLRLMGGMSFFSDSSGIVNVPTLGIGYSGGGELVWMFSHSWGAVLRAEYISSITDLTDATTGTQYAINVSSLPILAGPEYAIFGNAFSIHFAVLGGLAVPSSLTNNATTSAGATSQASFVSTHFVGMAKLNFNWQFSALTSFFVEGGYRYSVSTQFSNANISGTAAEIFQSSFPIDLSGPTANVGISFGF